MAVGINEVQTHSIQHESKDTFTVWRFTQKRRSTNVERISVIRSGKDDANLFKNALDIKAKFDLDPFELLERYSEAIVTLKQMIGNDISYHEVSKIIDKHTQSIRCK